MSRDPDQPRPEGDPPDLSPEAAAVVRGVKMSLDSSSGSGTVRSKILGRVLADGNDETADTRIAVTVAVKKSQG